MLAWAALVLAVLVLAIVSLAFWPAPLEASPPTLWVRAPVPLRILALRPGDVRVGAPDGPGFGPFVQVSSWGPAEGDDEGGFSLRRPREGWTAWRWKLAAWGVLPQARVVSAGYEATGRTETVDGETWRECVLFDPAFGMERTGWWPW